MLGKNELLNRKVSLCNNLKISEKRFNETKDLLKSLKKEITDTKGGIIEIDKLLCQYD
jgi:hypothetical protein